MYNNTQSNSIVLTKNTKIRSIISVLLSICLVFGIVAFSFAPVYADDTSIYSRSVNKYSFTDLFNMFMSNVIGWGTIYNSSSVNLIVSNAIYTDYDYVLGVYTYSDDAVVDNLKSWLTQHTAIDFDLLSWQPCTDKNGYRFYVNKNMDTVLVTNGSMSFKHTFNSNGNAIQNGGGGSGVSRENNYYTQSTNNNYNYDYGTTIETQILDSSNHTLNNIGNNSAVNFGDGYICYSPDNKTYYAFDTTNNSYYTVNNNYTYNNVNYYMPGADVPLNTWQYYYELPDGRNSATLTPDDVKGLNVDFDVVNYQEYAVDPYQQALFHFDGDIENSSAYSPLVYSPDIVDSSSLVPSIPSYLSAYHSSDGWHISRSGSTSEDFLRITFSVSLPYTPYSFSGSTSHDGSGSVYFYISTSTNFVQTSVFATSSSTFSSSSDLTLNSYYVTVLIRNDSSIQNFSFDIIFSGASSWGAGDGSISSGNNPTSWNWTGGASYQFVDTGTSFDAALYIDGSAHSSTVILPSNSLTQGLDWSIQYRWYQEISSSTVTSHLYIGNNSNTYRVTLDWDGVGLTSFCGSSISGHNFLVGQWQTITICRNSDTYLLFLNGLLVSSVTLPNRQYLADSLYFYFNADSNVKYFDELVVFSDYCLATSSFVPRLDPWDSNLAFVVPTDVVNNSIAIQSRDQITRFQLGGVRPTLPQRGDVFVSVSDGVITSIQIYTGYMWQPTLGAVYFNGHWFDLDGFNIHQFENDIDAPYIIPNGNGDGTGGGSSNNFSFWQLVYELIKPVISLLTSLVSSLVGLLSSFFSTIANLISGLIQGFGNFFSFLTPIGDFFSATWSAVPSDILGVVTGGFLVVLLIAALKLFL